MAVDIIRLNKYKSNRLQGKTKTQSMIDSGFAYNTAMDRCSDNKSVLIGEKEIQQEIDKAGLIKKAFIVLENELRGLKASDRITASMNILKFTIGEKLKTTESLCIEDETEYNTIKGEYI